jgi:subtilase family serine protease
MLHNLKVFGVACLLGLAAGVSTAATTTDKTGAGIQTPAANGSSRVRLRNHVPVDAMATAEWKGHEDPATTIPLTFALPLRDQAGMEDLLRRLYDPADPQYGHFLTSDEFAARFGPTQDDYDAVADYARGLGLTVTGTHSNRALLNVEGHAVAVEAAFNLNLSHFRTAEGREFHAPDNDPEVPDSVASRIIGVIGLDNSAVWHRHSTFVSAVDPALISPDQIGTGPGLALAPNDILTAYNLKGVAANGSGQTLALFELDGYKPADVAGYESRFGLPAVPLQNVLVDGFPGSAGSGAIEVTLDIELQIALSPGASRIIVYEGPNSSTGVVDTYHRIANDNLAKQISTSWGLSEGQSSPAIISSENAAFQQMAAQGQTIYAAAGDSGAFDNGTALSVDDPASQPFVTGVGGTHLAVNVGETYNHESSWNVNNTVSGGAGGGGVSSVWSIPAWQQGIVSVASTTRRNVPDVALNADQNTGYSIFFNGGWWVVGGTSCAAPLWAAFTARVNQQRSANGSTPLGFANPAIYQLASGAKYAADFHDIADGSTNLFYKAVTGYDNSTGWGSFNGANLLADLAPVVVATTPPPAPASLTAVAGNAAVTLNWSASSGATSYNVYRGTASGNEGTIPIAAGIVATAFVDSSVTNGVTYFYKVSATNSSGTSALSTVEASATPVAPVLVINSGPVASAGRSSAVITWTTNVAANSVVHFGTSSANLTRTASSSALATTHSLTLSGLTRRTTYFYQVSSTTGGVSVSSAVNSFRTQ